MSVINSVLRDLEAQEARFTPIDLDGIESPLTRSGRRNSVVAALALAAFVAIVAWLLWRVPAQETIAGLAPAIDPATLAELAAPAPPVEPTAPRNRIVGLQLRESNDGLRLEFALRERPVAYLRHSYGNRYGYHLRAVDSEIEAPRIDASKWLDTLALGARDGGIDIDFVTVQGVLVETRQAQVDNQPVWSIQLRRPPVSAPPAVASVSTPAESIASEVAAETLPVSDAAAATEAARVDAPTTDLAPADTDAAEVRLDIRSTDPAAPARHGLEYATELINAGRFADAETLLEGLLDGLEDRAAREHLLALYQLDGRQRDFARLVRESTQRYPTAAIFATEYARVLMQSAAYAEVVALLSPATDLDADRQALLAAAYQRLERHGDAIRHFELAVAQDSDEARHWIGLGISQEHAAALEDALNSYRMAARLGPPSERLRDFVAKRRDTLERVLD